jgi:hypothetical protein
MRKKLDAGSEHESVSSECEAEDGNCENSEAETDDRNGKQTVASEGE